MPAGTRVLRSRPEADAERHRRVLLALAERRRARIERGGSLDVTDDDCERSAATAMRLAGAAPASPSSATGR